MLDRRNWLRHHLATNHMPPLPGAYIEAAEQTIDRCRGGEPGEQIELPGGTSTSAENCVRAMHLRYFVELESFD